MAQKPLPCRRYTAEVRAAWAAENMPGAPPPKTDKREAVRLAARRKEEEERRRKIATALSKWKKGMAA